MLEFPPFYAAASVPPAGQIKQIHQLRRMKTLTVGFGQTKNSIKHS